MKKKLIKHGNSLAIIIDKPILKLLDIDEEVELKITTEGDKIIIEPSRKKSKSIGKISKDKKLQDAYKDIIKKYSPALKKLSKN